MPVYNKLTNRYAEHPAPASLAARVECSWSIEIAAPAAAWPVRPDGCLDIVYSRTSGLLAVGAMTMERRFDQTQGSFYCGIRFLPGMARDFLRTPLTDLTDQSVPLDDLLGPAARGIERRLSEAKSADECAGLLMASLHPREMILDPVQRAIAAMTRARGVVELDSICRQAGLSPRQFRRRCLEESGLTPKHLCRILRFRHALRLAETCPREWAGIAVVAGYFDQAHLIRDFREFTGGPPMAVFSNRERQPVS